MVKVFHCADIHLDSPFSLYSPKEAERRRTELRAAFTSAIMLARELGVQLFLISGDLFDGEYVTADTKELLLREFRSFPECRFFISPGNHDPLGARSAYRTLQLPDNVHVFSERERVSVPELGVDVYGFGYTSRSYPKSPVTDWHIENPDAINILVCHGDIYGDASVGPISKGEIGKSGFDYVALGHIHKGTGLLNENGVYYGYPGCIEGRSFDETGYKGVLIGTVDKGKCAFKPYRLSKRRYECVTVDISGAGEKLTALDIIRKSIRTYCDDTALRITLTGEVTGAFMILPAEIGKGREYPYRIDIIDKTTLAPDLGELEKSNTLKGVFCRMMLEKIAQCEKDSEEAAILYDALRYGLCALEDRSISSVVGGE